MKIPKITAILGSIFYLGPVFGLIGTIAGMLQAFDILAESGAENSESLSSSISLALGTTAIGLIIGIIGITLLCLALFYFKYRAKWFYVYLFLISTLTLLGFPFGTILGSLLLWYLISHKQEFFNSNKIR